MTIEQLEPHERLALGGLLRLLIRSDGSFSEEEEDTVNTVGDGLGGRALLWRCISDSAQHHHDDAAIRADAQRVVRAASRELILDALVRVARAGSIVPAEATLLATVGAMWGLPVA